MRFLVALFLLLLTCGYASAQTGCTPGSQAANLNALRDGQTTGSITPGVIRNLACSQPWNYVVPTNTSADVTNLQAAVNGSQPVMMGAGTWQICSQVTVPANQHVEGVYTSAYPANLPANQTYSKTVVTCPNNGSFSTGQAYIALKDHDVLRGIDFYCNNGLNPTYNGINALNANSVEVDHVAVFYCFNGISRFSDGNVPGFSEAYGEELHLHDSQFYGNLNWGYYCDGVNGGYCSDETIGPNNEFAVNGFLGAPTTTGAIFAHASPVMHIHGNRIEDSGGIGIYLKNGFSDVISGNVCDLIQCMKLESEFSVAVTGNVGKLDGVFSAPWDVEFAGDNFLVNFAGNSWYDTVYKVQAGATISGLFAEQVAFATTPFVDDYSKSVIQPLMTPTFAMLPSPAPPLLTGVSNHISSRAFLPTLSSCGTSPSLAGDDATGTITTGSGSPTACTLTFAVPYTVTPLCVPSTNSTSAVPDVSAVSTTAVTFSLSVTATKISYVCTEVIPNIFAGTVGMTGGTWATTASTFTTAAAVGPTGLTDAAKLIENGVNTGHAVGTVYTPAAGTYTMSAYVHAGTAGTDNIALIVFDSGFANGFGAVFNPSTGAFVGFTAVVGSVSATSTGSQTLTGGWFRVWITFTLGATQAFQFLELAHGTATATFGNSTDNVLLWGPTLRAGTLP